MTDPSDKARIAELERQLQREVEVRQVLVDLASEEKCKHRRWATVAKRWWRKRDDALRQLDASQAECVMLQRDADDANAAQAIYCESLQGAAAAVGALRDQLREAEAHIADLQDELAAIDGAGDDVAALAGRLATELDEGHKALTAAGIETTAPDDFNGSSWSALSIANRIHNLAYDRDELRDDVKRMRRDNADAHEVLTDASINVNNEALGQPMRLATRVLLLRQDRDEAIGRLRERCEADGDDGPELAPEPDEPPWWHRLEIGDVFYIGDEEAPATVLKTNDNSVCYRWDRCPKTYQQLYSRWWAECTPPLHLDPQWHLRAPVGTKLVDDEGDVAVVVPLAQYKWITIDGKNLKPEPTISFPLDSAKPRGLRPMSPRELRGLDGTELDSEGPDESPWWHNLQPGDVFQVGASSVTVFKVSDNSVCYRWGHGAECYRNLHDDWWEYCTPPDRLKPIDDEPWWASAHRGDRFEYLGHTYTITREWQPDANRNFTLVASRGDWVDAPRFAFFSTAHMTKATRIDPQKGAAE